MKQILIENLPPVSSLSVALLSELMALKPGWKYNGLLHALVGLLSRKKGQP